jgi:drug/metabolite transporter (DMT)-like permease
MSARVKQLAGWGKDRRQGSQNGGAMSRPESRSRGIIALALAVPASSSAAVLIRLAGGEGAQPLAIAALRLTFAALLITPIALIWGRAELTRLTRHDLAILIGSGLFLALHFGTWTASLSYTSVGSSVLLVTLQPVFVPWFGWLILHERVSRRGAVGLILAIAGAVVIGIADRRIGSANLVGDALALAGALSAVFYILAGRVMRTRVSLLTYVWTVYTAAAVALLATALIARVPLGGLSPMAYLWVLLVAIVCQVFGHTMYNLAVRHLPAYVAGSGWLFEPIGSTALAFLILAEAPCPGIYLGAPLIFAGVYIVLSQPADGAP